MPFGGLLPYGSDPLTSLFGGEPEPEVGRSGTPMAALPAARPQAQQGGGFDLNALVPQLLTAFSAGQAIRQRDPRALSSIVGQYIQAIEDQRRLRLAEEAQRLREEREGRLATFAEKKYQQDVAESKERTRLQGVDDQRQQRSALDSLIGQIEDNARQTFRPGFEGAPLEEYISQQSGRVAGMEGGDPAAVRALLMSLATAQSRPEEVPLITLQPGQEAPAMVPKGAIVRNAPQAPQGREAPLPIRVTDEQGNIYLADPRTGKRLSETPIGQRPKPAGSGNDAIDKIIAQATGGRGAAPPSGGPAPGTRRTINGQLAEWDGKGWLPVK